ncbi:uncharacterized protein LOC141674265 [Apium graveolens]|uniref:uncharacterized protein LOC141674265 n=1 Tax=Apium graveolens TaxID=4045 RepID=UPI003D7AD171
MLKQSPEVKKMYISNLEKMMHPETVIVEEPFSDRQSKKFKGSGTKESIPSEIPKFVVPYIHEYVNVSADGNCGYRSVAHQIYGSEDQWRWVRTDLHDFIETHLDYWMKVWHKNLDEVRMMLRRVNHCESLCSYEYWISLDEMGPVIASIYNVILVVLDPIQMGTLTYLPQYVPEGISSPEKLICITFIRSSNYFVFVCMLS